jgi:cell division protein FtsX
MAKIFPERFLQKHSYALTWSIRQWYKKPLFCNLCILCLSVWALFPLLGYKLYPLLSSQPKWKKAAEISLFLHPTTSYSRSKAIQTQLSAKTMVRSITYISPEQANQQLKDDLHLNDLGKIPLPPLLLIKAKDHTLTEELLQFKQSLRGLPETYAVKLDLERIGYLQNLQSLAQTAFFLLGMYFTACIGLLLYLLTKNWLFQYQDTLKVLLLIGAPKSYLRRNLFYLFAIITFFSSILTTSCCKIILNALALLLNNGIHPTIWAISPKEILMLWFANFLTSYLIICRNTNKHWISQEDQQQIRTG